MIGNVKSYIKKIGLQLSGRFDHLNCGIQVNKKWYGNKYGGFFVCPDSIDESSIIYSFGIGEDISFDEAIIRNHNSTVFGFDPTPKSIEWINKHKPQISSKFVFRSVGIGNKSGLVDFFLPKNNLHVSGSYVKQLNVDENQLIKVEMKSIEDIVVELNHDRIDILKMDIEGAEYQVLESILTCKVPIRQLLVEFHERLFKEGKQMSIAVINKLKARGYEIFGVSDSFHEVSFIQTKS